MKSQTSSGQIKAKPSFKERHYKLHLILKLITPVILVVAVLTLIAAVLVFRSMIYNNNYPWPWAVKSRVSFMKVIARRIS